MVFFKLLALGIAMGAGLLREALEYFWHDRRTKTHKRIRWVLIGLMLVGAVVAGLLVVLDDRQSANQIAKLTELKKGAEKAASDAAAREEDAKKDREVLKQKIDNLQRRIDPFVTLATARYPSLPPEKALEKLANDVKELRHRTEQLDARTQEISARDFFHPLSSDRRQLVVNNLRELLHRFPQRDISLVVSLETGHTGRQKIAKELIDILKEAGINVSGPTSVMTFSKGVSPPIIMELNPVDDDIGRFLAEALQPLLRVTFTGRKKKEIPAGKITIRLQGEPLFSDAGVITFP
jgi:hypothetical protein